MRTAESELLRKENNKRQMHTARFKDYWKLKFYAPKAVTMLTIRPEKLSRSTKFYALKALRLEAFFDSKTQNSFDPNELKFVEIVEII